uniref:Uncharacterized protein n=1 Tax=Pyxicephalus adspersus TaxID=30357 RepID=A0AAV3ARN3_PYXAD|nr:TPA: hypothetical protein GDO54_001642 [Pyxicephalus adspersus]
MSKCVRILKYMLFVFNLLFWALGCSIVAIGIYFVVHNIYGSLFPNIPSLTTGNVLILFGCVIMVFGFIGCMGAIKENKCLLLTVSIYRRFMFISSNYRGMFLFFLGSPLQSLLQTPIQHIFAIKLSSTRYTSMKQNYSDGLV